MVELEEPFTSHPQTSAGTQGGEQAFIFYFCYFVQTVLDEFAYYRIKGRESTVVGHPGGAPGWYGFCCFLCIWPIDRSGLLGV